MNDFIKKASAAFWESLENNQKRIRHLLGTDIIVDRLAMLTDIYMPAMVQHQKVFPKYKGINKEKTVVITGTGPTFKYYKSLPGAIHMGVNDAIYRDDILYDYIFVCDYCNQKKLFDYIFSYGGKLKKFFGIYYRREIFKDGLIPAYLREREDTETFYFDSYDYALYGNKFENSRKLLFPLDISSSPLKSYGTSLYCVFQFALWTHPEKIYIVGADCHGKGHADDLNVDETGTDYSVYIRPWRKLKEFAESYYPDIEVVSLNPVGLKGVFKDEYTDGYKEAISRR